MHNSGYGDAKVVGYKSNVPQKLVNMHIPYAAGSLTSSVSDFHLWDQSFYELTLIDDNSLKEIYPKNRNALGAGFGTGKFKVVMGLGWGIYETDFGPEYSHAGNVDGFSTIVSRYPSQKAMIVILSNQDGFDVYALKNRVADFILKK